MRLLFNDTLTGERYWCDVADAFRPHAIADRVLRKLTPPADLHHTANRMTILGWFEDGDACAVFILRLTDGLSTGLIYGEAHLRYVPTFEPRGYTKV